MSPDQILRLTPFRSLSRETACQLLGAARERFAPAGSYVLRQGERGGTLCIILEGEVSIYADGTGVAREIARLGPGECFGETTLFTEARHEASVRATRETHLIEVSRQAFERLAADSPEFSLTFARLLGERIARLNADLSAANEIEQGWVRLVVEQHAVSRRELIGISPGLNRLRQQAAELARQKLVLISGPPGTEKRALAWEVHHAGPDPDAPFLVLDAQAVTLTGQPAADEMELELSQACTLLGLRPGSLHLAGATRLGLLRAADGGTLVIENAESLAESLDIQLSDFVQTGRYQPLADDRRWASSVRLILTATQMRPDSRLAALARGSILVLPPLKQRKQDLLPMIEHLAREHGRLQGKNLRGIEPEAHARLMAYDWPGQTDELEVVIRRAASLAQGELLSADDVFLTASPSSSGGVLNLLTFTNPGRGALRGLLVGATVAGIAAFAFLLWQGWMGARAPHGRAALALTWVFWEPVIIFGSFFAARVWCSVCPIGAISGLISRVGLRRRVPLWLRDQGAWIPAAGVGAILWAQAAWDMNNSIRATAVLIWAILVPAVLMSVFYKRRAFCRYICPLGQMIGALSTCSTTELRGNAGICGTDCQDHRCYVGTGGKEGCPVFEGPFTLRSNTQCVVCFACVRTCTNASPAWNLRLPGAELWTATKPFSDLTVLIPALLGAQFFRSLVRAGLATRWSTPLELAVLCAAFVLVFTILARKAAEAIFSHEDRGYFIHALAMLAAAWEFSYQAGLLLTLAGTGWPPIMSLWAVDVFQAGLCLVGLGASLVVLRELIRRRAARPNAVIRFSLVGIGALEAFMQFLG